MNCQIELFERKKLDEKGPKISWWKIFSDAAPTLNDVGATSTEV